MARSAPIGAAGLAAVLVGSILSPAVANGDDPGVVADYPLAGRASAEDVREYWTAERMTEATAASPQEQTDTTTYPNRVVGRLFWTLESTGQDGSCTASVINSAGDDVVLTASHCIYGYAPTDIGRPICCAFRTNVNFVPGYRNGEAPFGEFPATELRVATMDIGEQSERDHGVVLVAPSPQSVEDTVGAFGVSLSASGDQKWRVYGYPTNWEFDGESLFTCDARTAITQFNSIGIRCDMAPGGPFGYREALGASGGPWVIRGTNLVTANSAYSEPERAPGILFGSRLRDAAASFYGVDPDVCGKSAPLIVGTEGPDRLVGTRGRDVILGDRGDDVIVGKGGRDKLCGEEGKDTLKGGGGRDLCDGGRSSDSGRGCERKRKL
jgi:V8-like Glu-specific endopeptidase